MKKLLNINTLLIGLVLLAGIIGLVYINATKAEGGKAIVILEKGKKKVEIDLSKDKIYHFDGNLEGEDDVTLEVKDGSIAFIHSKCPDKICEGYGFIRYEGEQSICLPAGVTVTIDKEEAHDSLAASHNSVNTSANSNSTSKSSSMPISDTGSKASDSSLSAISSSEESISVGKTNLTKIDTLDINIFSPQAIQWGHGNSVNEKNQSVACLNLQEKYGKLGGVFIMNDEKVYLSFDLGYEAGYTENILDTLKKNKVKAVFFLTDNYAKKNEDIVKRIISEGHTVGNHSTTHPDMTKLSTDEAKKEIKTMNTNMKELYGYTPYLFRCPEGKFSEKTLAIASECGMHSVFWSFAYNDWDNAKQPDTDFGYELAVKKLHKGAIYLMHPMKTNSDILDKLIVTAKEKGFEFGVL